MNPALFNTGPKRWFEIVNNRLKLHFGYTRTLTFTRLPGNSLVLCRNCSRFGLFCFGMIMFCESTVDNSLLNKAKISL